eukprot:m.338327 g.338327  ORF g.338327 m.338327 type:complete len:501 (+) comp18385_c0_seq1:178-1680(+)
MNKREEAFGHKMDPHEAKFAEATAPPEPTQSDEWVHVPPPYTEHPPPLVSKKMQDKAIEYAREAIEADLAGKAKDAGILYCKAAGELKVAEKMETNHIAKNHLRQKYLEYLHRAEQLSAALTQTNTRNPVSTPPQNQGKGKAPAPAPAPPSPRIKHKPQGTPQWKQMETRALRHYQAAVAFYSDRMHRQSKKEFMLAAEGYGEAIRLASLDRQDIVGYLSTKMDKALKGAESLNSKLSRTYATEDDKHRKGLEPLFTSHEDEAGPDGASSQPSSQPKTKTQHQKPQNPPNVKKEKDKYPPYWPAPTLAEPGAPYARHMLLPSSRTYREASARFYETMNPMHWRILTIEGIQNPTKWNTYTTRRATMERSLPHGSQEMQAFCAVNPSDVRTVLAHGFLREHTPLTSVGIGCYFAKDVSYFVPQQAVPDQGQVYTVFLASILVGEPCIGYKNKALPDEKRNGLGALHESFVDNLIKPSVFVLGSGNEDHAYPDIMITCQKIS